MKVKKRRTPVINDKSKQLIAELQPFARLIKKSYIVDSILSRQQLNVLTQASKRILQPVQSLLDNKLIQQPLQLTTLTYQNDLRHRQLQVVFSDGQQYDVHRFLQELNRLLSQAITEEEFYHRLIKVSSQPMSVKQSLETRDKNQRANQVLKQRIRQLTIAKSQLAKQHDQALAGMTAARETLHIKDMQYQQLQEQYRQLEKKNDDYQFKLNKQTQTISDIREQIRIQQTQNKHKQLTHKINERIWLKHVCPKVDDRQFKEKIKKLQDELGEVQQQLRQVQSPVILQPTLSRSEQLRHLTSDLHLDCIDEYHPLLRLVQKYNELIAEDLVLWHQIQGYFEQDGDQWLFIDRRGQQYNMTHVSLNGLALSEITLDYYYSARQRIDTGHIMLIRQLNEPIVQVKTTISKNKCVATNVQSDKQVLIISWWGETVKNAAKKLKQFGVTVIWLDPSDLNNDKIIHEMQKSQYDFQLVVMRGAHHEIVTAAHRLRRLGYLIKVANNPGASAMVQYVSEALALNTKK